jgi:hypothetical protein
MPTDQAVVLVPAATPAGADDAALTQAGDLNGERPGVDSLFCDPSPPVLQLYMAIWPAQPDTALARRGTGTIGTSMMRHDVDRARAVPALRAEAGAQH